MINRIALLDDLQALLKKLEADLLERSEDAEVPEVKEALEKEFNTAKEAERTALSYEIWLNDYVTQMAAAWVLSCVFARFLEDNELVAPPKISGPGDSLQLARDQHEIYFRAHPTETDREYLLSVFEHLATMPGCEDVFGGHNLVRQLPYWLSGDAAKLLLDFFKQIDSNTGQLIHDFTDPDWNTRFLGDLYQDLSLAARKKYALLQTPDFVEEFILDRTLEPALDEFGLEPVVSNSAISGQEKKLKAEELKPDDYFKMIDPACGSGHFLLGSFPRILARWKEKEPKTNIRTLIERTLLSIHGVDINPFAIAIARFRLLLAALKACGMTQLADAPEFQLKLACGDSLYHGIKKQLSLDFTEEAHYFRTEDVEQLNGILQEGAFHCVVANPPYSVPDDRALNQVYRRLYSRSCHGKYSLTIPFMERIFNLAKCANDSSSGFTGQITATSFMKRSFGKKLTTEFFATIDLTHVIDLTGVVFGSSGFGGTSTVMIFGRAGNQTHSEVRTVMGLRGEPGSPSDPANGIVWNAIKKQIDQPGSDSEYVSVRDLEKKRFLVHPWSLGGGQATELMDHLKKIKFPKLGTISDVGVAVVTLEDQAYELDASSSRRNQIAPTFLKQFVIGEAIREWALWNVELAIFPHHSSTFEPVFEPIILKRLWNVRTGLKNRLWFRKTMSDRGMLWFEYGHISRKKFQTDTFITFAFMATHNHFVLIRSGSIFKQSSPVIKLKKSEIQLSYLALLGVLNSSIACFWMKQVFHCHGAGGGTRVKAGKSPLGDDNWESHYEYDSTKIKRLPIPESASEARSAQIFKFATSIAIPNLKRLILLASNNSLGLKDEICSKKCPFLGALAEMIRLQEDLDWECYRLYGLLEEDLTYPVEQTQGVKLGERAFEIVMARKMAAGDLQTTWFERHGSLPITEIPGHWPVDYKQLVQRRIDIIESDKNIALIEQPEYKRRWDVEPWESQVQEELKSWLLDRLETYFDFDGRMHVEPSRRGETEEGRGETDELPKHKLYGILGASASPRFVSIAQISDTASQDGQFMEVAEVYKDDSAFDVTRLVTDLVKEEHVPLLPVLRYKSPGLRKRTEWEKTWELQRAEDALGDRLSAISDQLKQASDESEKKRLKAEQDKLTAECCELTASIPVPPKYTSGDFISTGGAKYWKLRGKLDVPKERWVSFPHCEGNDGTLMIAWAGYNHLQLALAISGHFILIRDEIGGTQDPRLIPLLTGLLELLPWLKQWHHDIHPEYDQRMDEYFDTFIKTNANDLRLSLDEIKAWKP